jgi:hypothetical protein
LVAYANALRLALPALSIGAILSGIFMALQKVKLYTAITLGQAALDIIGAYIAVQSASADALYWIVVTTVLTKYCSYCFTWGLGRALLARCHCLTSLSISNDWHHDGNNICISKEPVEIQFNFMERFKAILQVIRFAQLLYAWVWSGLNVKWNRFGGLTSLSTRRRGMLHMVHYICSPVMASRFGVADFDAYTVIYAATYFPQMFGGAVGAASNIMGCVSSS